MRFLLLLLLLISFSLVSAYVFELANAKDCMGGGEKSGFTKYYAVPIGTNKEADFTLIEVVAIKPEGNSLPGVPLKYPTSETIEGVVVDVANAERVCYEKTTPPASPLEGIVYFTQKELENMDVYYYASKNYSVVVAKPLTTFFSKTGSTVSNFQTTKDTAFQIHPGTPEDGRAAMFTYDSEMTLEEIFVPESYFYINNTGGITLNLTVTNQISNPLTKVFDSNGYISSPDFPNHPPVEYLNTVIHIANGTKNRNLKIKVYGIRSPDIQLDEKTTVTVTAGDADTTVVTTDDEVKLGELTVLFTTGMDSFQVVSVGSAYSIQFELEEIVPSTTPAAKTTTKKAVVTTGKPTLAPGGTCPPVTTCPVCPKTTCPAVNPCSCSTSTTEIPTTTDGSFTLSVTSLISFFIIYHVL